jgi:putative hydrolase of the HAD superfamily
MTRHSKYKHLFFDLDHTLWDFDANARETLIELYDTYDLCSIGLDSADLFIDTYTFNNHRLWREYHNGTITKEELRMQRFRNTFIELGLHEEMIPENFETDYVSICPTKTNLLPNAIEVLEELQSKYELHIITNGFKDSSEMKISLTGLKPFFKNMFVSEVIGKYKPDKALFEYALQISNAGAHETLMIGDSLEADIAGAKSAGIDQVFFNPTNQPDHVKATYEIKELKELLHIL